MDYLILLEQTTDVICKVFDCTNKIFEKVENYKNDSSYDKEAIYKNRDNLQRDDTGTDKNQV